MKTFLATIALFLSMVVLLIPYFMIIVGVVSLFPFFVKVILIVVGVILVSIVRPISIITHNDKLMF